MPIVVYILKTDPKGDCEIVNSNNVYYLRGQGRKYITGKRGQIGTLEHCDIVPIGAIDDTLQYMVVKERFEGATNKQTACFILTILIAHALYCSAMHYFGI